MTLGEKVSETGMPLLEIELTEISNGCLVRLSGDLVEKTRTGLWSVESMMANEARVVLDVAGVTSIDGPGLEAALRLMHTVHSSGGTVNFGAEQYSLEGDP